MIFFPIQIANLHISNRIVVAPMCQYSSVDGAMTDWHTQHLMQLGYSGAGLVMVEATAVERIGRITHHCVGLYNDFCERSIKKTLEQAKSVSQKTTTFGIQLAHAGRKASTQRPWEGRKSLTKEEDPWITMGASSLAFDEGWHIPQFMEDKDLESIKNKFVEASLRAIKIGFDLIEIHGTHGYLFHQFLSSLSNQRSDKYGGSLENRMRYPLEVFSAIKEALPRDFPLGMRITGTEWEKGGIDEKEAIIFAKELQKLGCHYVCVSSGGNTPNPKIPIGPHYQVHLAKVIKQNTKMVVRAVGMITDPIKANQIIMNKETDMVAMARAFLTNPRWVWDAAKILNYDIEVPPQYARRF
ncbi:NADH:flavin oxidoreductase/NADH oxidase [Alphaproteobacteria bacterium]|nr:NADH:flavin oxidoreductase/NADH oxidase [Alphaproteobacteria bacterium]MDC1023332.1 NADH:flavin oxidoreductase/NADH oxidase [Alphaproteobacteria bacterium]